MVADRPNARLPALRVGTRTIDVRARALIVFPLVLATRSDLSRLAGAAERAVADGADILELSSPSVGLIRESMAKVGARVNVPFAVFAGDAHAINALSASQAGIVVAHEVGDNLTTQALIAAAKRGKTVIVTQRSVAQELADRGVDRGAIVLDAAYPGAIDECAGMGVHVLWSATGGAEGGRADQLATATWAIWSGVRLLRTDDVVGAARVRRTLEWILADGLDS